MRQLTLRLLAGAGGLLVLALVGWVGLQWWGSRLPSTYDAMALGIADYGGGPAPAGAADALRPDAVKSLRRAPQPGRSR
jgi:hypothetical protein